MKVKELKKVRGLSKPELQKKLLSLKKSVREETINLSVGKQGNLRLVKNLRREIAQILTVMKEKERKDKK